LLGIKGHTQTGARVVFNRAALGRVVRTWGKGILPVMGRERVDRGGTARIGEAGWRPGTRD
jgi:hypothetical protein